MAFERILERIEAEVRGMRLKHVQLLAYDRWLLASLLQKAIRRGETKRVASAALSLWTQDRRMFWRRCAVIAAEDVGMGSFEAVLEAVAICKSASWRRKVGDAHAAVYIAQRMAGVPKSRFLTELYFQADRSHEAEAARQEVASVGFSRLKDILYDPESSTTDKALSMWAVAGTYRFPAKGFSRPVGDRARLLALIEGLHVPGEVKLCAAKAGFDTPWPLMLFLPLAWQEFDRQKGVIYIANETPISTAEIEGMPTYAVDALYTRTGKACVRKLRNTVSSLQAFSHEQIGEAIFFLEAELLDKRSTSRELINFRRKSIKTVMADLGVGCDDYCFLHQTLLKHWDILTEVRIAKLRELSSVALSFEGKL